MIKIEIYSPNIQWAAELAADMDLHITQWEYGGDHPDFPGITWANCEPLFERIKWLEENHGVS